VLIAIGIGSGIGSSATESRTSTLHAIDYLIGGIDLLDSLVVGTVRGFTVRLYQRDGAPWYRYGPATGALWLLSILIRVPLAILGSAHRPSALTGGNDLVFMLGLALLCQNVVVVRRRIRAAGSRPPGTAPVRDQARSPDPEYRGGTPSGR
jgi:hypothetical protein